MKLQRGEAYSITYKSINKTKIATFVSAGDGVNMFFDISGQFGLSDAYIASGSVVITELDSDF
ncbi:hypothetical protein D3C73_1615970 [compost metagenome]